MMVKKVIAVLGAFILMWNCNVNAEQSSIERLKLFLATTTSISAEFKQVGFNENGMPAQTSYGDFFLSRPGKFRWNYTKPFVQEIVSNEGLIWFFDADLEQVTVKKMDDSLGSTPALLLSGEIDLDDNFNIKAQGVDEDLQWIKLTPKNENSGFKYILFGLDEQGLAGMELSDNFGQLTRIYFSKVKKNQALDEKLFIFKVPEGVDVIEN